MPQFWTDCSTRQNSFASSSVAHSPADTYPTKKAQSLNTLTHKNTTSDYF